MSAGDEAGTEYLREVDRDVFMMVRGSPDPVGGVASTALRQVI
jgi:hypothetical protein